MNFQTDKEKPEVTTSTNITPEAEKILCPHCQRTATNGIKCKGICVADNDY
jgi:NMD protein affecting ribosome stability and mRNA decay